MKMDIYQPVVTQILAYEIIGNPIQVFSEDYNFCLPVQKDKHGNQLSVYVECGAIPKKGDYIVSENGRLVHWAKESFEKTYKPQPNEQSAEIPTRID